MTITNEQTMEQRLLHYYVMLRTPIPEGGAEWNLSPEHNYLFGFAVRDFIRRSYNLSHDIRACNVGIGVGDWDDFLGYWLKDWGTLTSVDIDTNICELFAYRQQRERHPNPSRVINEDLFNATLERESFDLVTIIGSTAQETHNPAGAVDCCFNLVKPGGYLFYMGTVEPTSGDWFEQYLDTRPYVVTGKQLYDYFPEMICVAFLVYKPVSRA